MTKDVIVLGAGIVGVSVALHLQQRGRDVVLVDRRAPGEETSFGNAGLIESSSVVPYGFPRDWRTVLRLVRNDSTALRYDLRSLPSYASWLARFWWESAPRRLEGAARDMLALIQRSVPEHEALIERAGLHDLVRPTGWLEAYRSPALFERESIEAARVAQAHGLHIALFDTAGLRNTETSLGAGYAGAVHWTDPRSVSDPGALTKGYARLFEREGGTIVTGDAATLEARPSGWRVLTDGGAIEAESVVVALGPWSDLVLEPFGYRVPLIAKRGYHMHYGSAAGSPLLRPIVDIEGGYVVAPMRRGLRLTTGVELAGRARPPNPAQLDLAERAARPLFGLGKRLDDEPWLGLRPCTPSARARRSRV
jgi:D-amino-acid dehydrogenase